jgi:hypothetical protein
VEARDEAEPDEGGESHRRKAEPGSGFLELGASKGRKTLREEGRERTVCSRTVRRKVTTGEAVEVLEGERKSMSGIQTGQETGRSAVGRKTPGSTPKGEKDVGGVGKPNHRLRTTVIR